MRGTKFVAIRRVNVLAIALVLSACSDPWGGRPDPSPSVTGDGMITDLTFPGAPFDEAEMLGLGPEGEALVWYSNELEPGDESPQDVGLALVYRDGSYDPIRLGANEPVEMASQPLLSDSTITWVVNPYSQGKPPYISFWNRGTGEFTKTIPHSIYWPPRFPSLRINPSTPMVLVDDTVYWLQDAGSETLGGTDPVQENYAAVVASSADGRTWLPFDQESRWIDLGFDECSSTPDRPILWGSRSTGFSDAPRTGYTQESVHIDVSDPYAAHVVDGSTIAYSTDYPLYGPPVSRCGDDLLAPIGEPKESGWNQYGLISTDDPMNVKPIENAPEETASAATAQLTPEWISLAMYASDPDSAEDEPSSRLDLHLIHRETGRYYVFTDVASSNGFSVFIRDGFIADSTAAWWGAYVGVLTPPTG